MKAIFECYEEPMDKLEVQTQTYTVRLTSKPNCNEESSVVLDKKAVVGLIQILAECLMEID